jgi:rhamnose utilization protein RhaD (predicted bifunctional aldolase and dehydrogenase)
VNVSGEQLRTSVIEYCAVIGKDPLLVQGAGGNVSWKDGDTLWVKASGTWLADAAEKDVFVPVDLKHLRNAIDCGDFSVTPKVLGESTLRPSIETLLHALMPHPVVLHLHAVEVVAHLVRKECEANIQSLIGESLSWVIVDYHKPGEPLVAAVSVALAHKSSANVIFLRNHGMVIGATSVADIEVSFRKLLSLLQNTKAPLLLDEDDEKPESVLKSNAYYSLCTDQEVNQLATNSYLSARVEREWVLYPDHAVFLGDKAAILGVTIDVIDLGASVGDKPVFIFDFGKGIYESPNVTKAQKAQLRCYYDVVIRQPLTEKLVMLSPDSIAELLDWDAEKYRIEQAK